MKRGPKRKLTVEQQTELTDCVKLRRQLTNKSLARRFGVSPSNVAIYVRRLITKGEAPRE